jgi:hypothetical protein
MDTVDDFTLSIKFILVDMERLRNLVKVKAKASLAEKG